MFSNLAKGSDLSGVYRQRRDGWRSSKAPPVDDFAHDLLSGIFSVRRVFLCQSQQVDDDRKLNRRIFLHGDTKLLRALVLVWAYSVRRCLHKQCKRQTGSSELRPIDEAGVNMLNMAPLNSTHLCHQKEEQGYNDVWCRGTKIRMKLSSVVGQIEAPLLSPVGRPQHLDCALI
ncbi:hypothetical protein Q8A73_012555 [Channa argus]|nr:hypothetical protein Q8A73_012555 [Channa argus]